MALTRDDVAPLAASLVSAADRLKKEAELLRELHHHPAWIGSNVGEIAKDVRLLGQKLHMLQGWQAGNPKP